MPSDPQPNKQDKRRRPQRKVEILQAVATLLENGSNKITTAALAEHLGVSEAALYRHFKSKEAIFQELTSYIEDHLLRPANQLMSSNASPLSQLAQLLKYHLSFLSQHPGLCRIFLVEGVVGEASGIAETMNAALRKYQTQIKQILRRGQAVGEVPEDLFIEEAAQMFVGILQSRALVFVLSRYSQDPAKGWEVVWMFYLRAIQGVVAGQE
ncbi:MAG: nucleoid occlusion factor SlmA [Magnetococcales bacterium]|nr:nucleoid occlusion factor SlmA [Magnetococcales bacterium]NGZ25714.1 nucleoid occlusion factor SlmA [Magnetococcales bacterium]